MNKVKDYSEEEWSNRVSLSACYHLADHFLMSDIIWNHITAKTSSEKDTFLINKFGLRYAEITASNPIKIGYQEWTDNKLTYLYLGNNGVAVLPARIAGKPGTGCGGGDGKGRAGGNSFSTQGTRHDHVQPIDTG